MTQLSEYDVLNAGSSGVESVIRYSIALTCGVEFGRRSGVQEDKSVLAPGLQ